MNPLRILHTADWHIGKRLHDFNRLQEQREVLDEIIAIADRELVDLILVAGDLFDTFNPSAEAEDLLYSTLKRLTSNGKRPVIVVAGNHDNPDRIEAQNHFGRECGILFSGFPKTEVSAHALNCEAHILKTAPGFVEIQLPAFPCPIRLILTPYANENRMRSYFGLSSVADELRAAVGTHWTQLANEYMDDTGINLLIGHLFVMKQGGEQPEESDDERSILQVGGASVLYSDMIPSAVQYAALGHLHRHQVIDGGPCPVVYSSSPLAYSFAEADQQKFVMLIDALPAQPVSLTPLPLQSGRRLLRKRFTAVDDAVEWLENNPTCFPEITLQTPTFLTAEDRRRLSEAHDSLSSGTIIPDIQDVVEPGRPSEPVIDLTRSMEALFVDYFKTKNKGQVPDERLRLLFHEILSTNPE